jgi:hypothetical protein
MKLGIYGFILTVVVVFVFSGSSCDRACDVECFTPPGPLSLQISDKTTGDDLIYNGVYNADTITIFYFDKNVKTYIDFSVNTDSVQQYAIINSSEIPWKSVEGFKDFYLYLNAEETDTIYFDVISRSEDCCTYHPFIYFGINGNEIVYDATDYWYDYKK